jgi:ketosteroid isomerase-like protein
LGGVALVAAVSVAEPLVARAPSSPRSAWTRIIATPDHRWTALVSDDATAADPSAFAATAAARVPSDSTGVVAVVTAFHAALARGDSVTALKLLAPDVVIMEAGGIELLVEYRSHHLADDIAFARAIPAVTTLNGVIVQGDVAWVSSTSVTEGHFNGRAVNSAGAELVVLSRQSVGAPWMIRAVHWSSRRRTP